jgi:hypothetical protein
MKIGFVRSGGFAGMRLALDVDTTDLTAEEASQLAQLIDEARNALTDAPRSKPEPDRFEYQLTFEGTEWGRETHLVCEPDVPESVRPLIEQLTSMARRRRA